MRARRMLFNRNSPTGERGIAERLTQTCRRLRRTSRLTRSDSAPTVG